MEKYENMRNYDIIKINVFGKEKEVDVFSTGDNKFDEECDYKEDGFELSKEEIECLNWFVNNINIDDYKKQILKYCNQSYSEIGDGDKRITEDDLDNEVDITGIAINISEITQSKSGYVYPEISFVGECGCDPEHGMCIGFRDGKFLGIEGMDWTL